MLVRNAMVIVSVLIVCPAVVTAQTSSSVPESGATMQPLLSGLAVPALTPVELVLDAELGSKISTTGTTFALHLGKAIVLGGREVVAAGTEGQGEIIHAKKAGGSGSSGELVLAARFLKVGDRQLKLRSMHVAAAGKDATAKVDGLNAVAAGASVFVPVPIGIIGFGITGSNILLPKGTVAVAKTAEDFAINLAMEPPPASAQTHNSPTQPIAVQ